MMVRAPWLSAHLETRPANRIAPKLTVGMVSARCPDAGLIGQESSVIGKVFLSYAREDLAAVSDEAPLIAALGHEVFLDVNSLRAGEEWPARLLAEIGAADRFILFWSAFSARSEWVKREYTEALAIRGRQEHPLYLQIVRLDKEPLPNALANIQTIDRSREERIIVVTDEVQQSLLQKGLAALFEPGTLLHIQPSTPRTIRVVAQKAEAALMAEAALVASPPGPDHYLRAASHLPASFSFPIYRRPGRSRTVVFVPGFMGSHLDQKGQRIWMDSIQLVSGEIQRLAIDSPQVTAEDLLGVAGDAFVKQMGLTSRVIVWPYDWRLSVFDVADLLAARLRELLAAEPECAPVFVGYGNGCAVLRALAASDGKLWRVARGEAAPVIFVAPHEHGTWMAAEILLGCSKTLDVLGMLDLLHTSEQVHQLFARFPAVVEMLPSSPGADLFDPEWWAEQPHPPRNAALAQARATRAALQQAIPPADILCILGEAASTVASIRMEQGRPVRVLTSEGDGNTPWDLGLSAGVTAYRAAMHANNILTTPLCIRAIEDLIDHGATTLLPLHRNVPARR